ncbi:hypothetical protein H3143_02215 [Mycoplasma tullyi]|uniref:Uncharacterized protein n=1 Tax=Mycoplasma tullyi TaxID=1612150 RepID=A0A7D7YFG2_9MOLU|nr:hypothetical protein [Mycoplasma tullyi]QMT98300.1 hypothetical protein H3143_02215 [Mycoplasma tullyi]
MLKEDNEPTSQPDLEDVKQSHTKLIQEQEQLNLELKTDKHNEVYEYQSNSKLDKLPQWTKVLIIIFLTLLCVGCIVGTVFAVMAAKTTTS